MRQIILTFFFLLFTLQAFSKTIVISDVDDTIRSINRYADYLEQLSNAMDPQRAFGGMSLIYSDLNAAGAEIYYVSGAVEPLIGYSRDFLNVSQFPQAENFYHRGWFEDTYDFKVRTIMKLLKNHSNDNIVLIGDNGERDVAVYAQVAKRYPNAFIYIHKLFEGGQSMTVPSTQNKFLSAADLAIKLRQIQLLSSDEVQVIHSQIIVDLTTSNSYFADLVFPPWAQVTDSDIQETFTISSPLDENYKTTHEIKALLFP